MAESQFCCIGPWCGNAVHHSNSQMCLIGHWNCATPGRYQSVQAPQLRNFPLLKIFLIEINDQKTMSVYLSLNTVTVYLIQLIYNGSRKHAGLNSGPQVTESSSLTRISNRAFGIASIQRQWLKH